MGSVNIDIQALLNAKGPGNITGKWIGIKAIFYNVDKNLDASGGPKVKIELWYDLVGTGDFDIPPNSWVEYFTIIDDGKTWVQKVKQDL